MSRDARLPNEHISGALSLFFLAFLLADGYGVGKASRHCRKARFLRRAHALPIGGKSVEVVGRCSGESPLKQVDRLLILLLFAQGTCHPDRIIQTAHSSPL